MNLQIDNNLFAVSIYVKLPLININKKDRDYFLCPFFIDFD